MLPFLFTFQTREIILPEHVSNTHDSTGIVCLFVFVFVFVYGGKGSVYIYIYILRERKRERERKIGWGSWREGEFENLSYK